MTQTPHEMPPHDPETAHLPSGPSGPSGRRWRRLDRLAIAAFVLLLPLPALAMVAGIRPPMTDNRPLFTTPPITLAGLGDPAWYAAIDHAVGDNVSFRALAIRVRSRIASGLGATSNPNVIRGTGDWLFAKEELVPTCNFTVDQLMTELDGVEAAFGAAGQDFRFIVAPDKHTIYPDALLGKNPYPIGCAEQRQAALEAAMQAPSRASWAVPLWQTLTAARAASPNGTPLYWHQDTHWAPTGAVVGIKQLVLSFDPSLWSDADVVNGTPRWEAMDLARQLGVPGNTLTPEPNLRPGVTVVRSQITLSVPVSNARAIWEFKSSGDRTVLPGRTAIVYDSFFGINMVRVSAFFADAVWIHEGDLINHPELAALTGPFDRIVYERVERGLFLDSVQKLLSPLVRAK